MVAATVIRGLTRNEVLAMANISQDSRVVTARAALERSATRPPEGSGWHELASFYAGRAGELRECLRMLLEAFTLTDADRELLSDAIGDAQDMHLRASINCAACDAADRAQTAEAVCDRHRPGMDKITAYQDLARRLYALGLLPEGGQR